MSVDIYMTDPPQSGASPLPHLDLHKVWRPCTASMHHEPASGTAPTPQTFAPPPEIRQPKTPKPRIPGLFAVWSVFFEQLGQCGTRPAITLIQPSFGDLGTGRPRIPSLHPGCLMRTASRSTPLSGTSVQAGRGFPL